MLRIVQEALANVFRHAQATQVKVAMVATDAHVRLQVTDNGRGMPSKRARSGPKAISYGVGIPGMRARLRQFSGTLEIHAAAGGRGTALCAVIPHFVPLKSTRQAVRRHPGHQRSVAQPL
jgi:two-component system NarL family sensor kinase